MKKSVTIIGAGFSGLASAFYLVRAGYSVEIHEERSTSGGLISTLQTPHGLVETAANAFLNSRLVEDLFTAVNVPMIGTKPSARRRFIFRGGHCRRWPLEIWGSLRVAGFLFQYFFDRRAVLPREGESVQAWGHRTLGEEASCYLVDAALQGIYAGDPSRLSARLILGRFFSPKLSSFKPPRIRGSVAPPNGMGQLIAGLESYLRSQGVEIRYNSAYKLSSAIQHPVIIATDPVAAASLLENAMPAKAECLRRIELSPIVTTTAFFERTDRATEGFGVLFPPIERRRALGVLKNGFIFEGRAPFSETWIQGGALSIVNPASQSDDEIINTIVDERSQVFALNQKPVAATITKWPKAIPHYTLELEKMIPELERSERNIFLMGNYLGDLGLAKILERASRLPAQIERDGQWL